MTRWLKWTLGIAAGVFLVLVGAFLWLLRPAHITSMVQDGLDRHLAMDAAIEEVSVHLFPRPSIDGRGLSIRVPDAPDLPPFVSIDEFHVNIGLFSLMRKQVDTVYATGLRIAVPPGDARDALPKPSSGGQPTEIIIRNFVADDAALEFVRSEPGRKPLTFEIHNLHVRDIGFGLAMPFDADITNPIPRGLVKAQGSFGPLVPGAVVQSPLDGKYTFIDADLGTINGIGGTLQSTGEFSGVIQRIEARGESRTPDFSLDLGGRPLPLDTRFDATITGTNGTTVLNNVDAVLVDTHMNVSGAVLNLDGPGNHDLEFTVKIEDGRIEDVLGLVIDAPQPVMTGDLSLDAHMKLPPGQTPVSQRLQVEGRFGLTETRFTEREVQSKMEALSRRSQGKDEDDPLGRVMTNLRGQIRLANGSARLSRVTFRVPGAQVALNGSYALRSGELDFEGELRMQASVSQAVGGFKSIFIRPFNPLFRKNGHGAVVPIKISGTQSDPKFGLRFGEIF